MPEHTVSTLDAAKVIVQDLATHFDDFGKISLVTSSASVVSPVSWSAEQVVGAMAVIVLVLFILAGNLLVIVSVVRFRRLRLPANYFLVSLAVVDIVIAIVTPFVVIVEALPGQMKDTAWCLVPNRTLMTACAVSILTLAAIAYDRHTALVRPFKYLSVMTVRKIVLLVTLIWVYSAVVVWTPFLLGRFSLLPDSGDDMIRDLSEYQSCSFQGLHDIVHLLFLGAIFGPACLGITVCYCRIYAVARRHARDIAAVENSVRHKLKMRLVAKDAKYTKTLALVIGVFLTLWLPYLICLLLEVCTALRLSNRLWNYLTLLAVLNSGLNPWTYALKNKEFREAFRKIFQSCCCSMFRNTHSSRLYSGKRSTRGNSMSDGHHTNSSGLSRMSRPSFGSSSLVSRLSDASYCVVNMTGVGGTETISNAPIPPHTICNTAIPHNDTVRGCSAANVVPADHVRVAHSDLQPVSVVTRTKGPVVMRADLERPVPNSLTLYLQRCLTDPLFDTETREGLEGGDGGDRTVTGNERFGHCHQGDQTYCGCRGDNIDNSEHMIWSEQETHCDCRDHTESCSHSNTSEHIYNDIGCSEISNSERFHYSDDQNDYHSHSDYTKRCKQNYCGAL